MTSKTLEVLVGFFVVAGVSAFLLLAFQVSGLGSLSSGDGYEIEARFDGIGSLKVRAPVSMAGVRIGRVAAIHLDQDSYQAVVRLRIESRYARIPLDSTASILTAGLLGEQYVGLEPGGDPAFMKAGDQITLTQSALLLEQLVGQFIYGKAESGAPAGSGAELKGLFDD